MSFTPAPQAQRCLKGRQQPGSAHEDPLKEHDASLLPGHDAAPSGEPGPAAQDGSSKGGLSNRRARKLSVPDAAAPASTSGDDFAKPNGRSPVFQLAVADGGGSARGVATTSGAAGHWPGAPGLLAALHVPRRTEAALAETERVRRIAQLQSEMAARVSELCALAEGAVTEEERQRAEDFGIDLPHPHGPLRARNNRRGSDGAGSAGPGTPSSLAAAVAAAAAVVGRHGADPQHVPKRGSATGGAAGGAGGETPQQPSSSGSGGEQAGGAAAAAPPAAMNRV